MQRAPTPPPPPPAGGGDPAPWWGNDQTLGEGVVVDPRTLALEEELVHATWREKLAEVDGLIGRGAPVDSRDRHRFTCLMLASKRGFRPIVALLLQRGAAVNAVSSNLTTALLAASAEGHLSIVLDLHDRGADIHHVGPAGRIALHEAAFNDHLPVCEFLLSQGADLTAKEKEGQCALSHYGSWASRLITPETKALRCAALEAAWAAGPHPSQVQRRRDERWFRRGPILWVLAEHGFRPLQHRALAIFLAAAGGTFAMQHSGKSTVFRHDAAVRRIVLFL